MDSYFLDTSALLTFRNREPGADQVQALLRLGEEKKAALFLSCVSVTEIFYITWQRWGKSEAYKVHLQLKMLPLTVVALEEEALLLAGELKANHTLSLADSFVAATAYLKKSILVHKDPDFDALEDRLSLISLPYKKSAY